MVLNYIFVFFLFSQIIAQIEDHELTAFKNLVLKYEMPNKDVKTKSLESSKVYKQLRFNAAGVDFPRRIHIDEDEGDEEDYDDTSSNLNETRIDPSKKIQQKYNNFRDISRFKLSQKNAYRAVSIQKEPGVTLLFINTYIPTLEKEGYQYVVVRSADQVYFTKTVFNELVKFFYSEQRIRNIAYVNVEYNVIKHVEIPSFPHITIFMKIQLNEDKNNPIYVYRGIMLTIDEYINLVHRAFQSFTDLENAET